MIDEGKFRIQTSGAIRQTSIYISRPADDELYQLLSQGEYCNLLCSRQMGKTSLLKKTRGRLSEAGYLTAEVDIAGEFGKIGDADEWYEAC